MLRKRKTFAAVVALVLSVMMLASCTGSTTGSSGNEKLELTVWNTQGTSYTFQDLAEDIPSDWLEEKTGVSVQNIYGNDSGQWDAKLTKLYAGNNLPDILWCQSGQGPAHFNKLLDLGVLNLLDEEMIKEYAPNIWKRTPSYVWEHFKTEDGKITGIPFHFANNDIETVYYDRDPEELKELVAKKGTQQSSIQTAYYIRDDILKQIYPDCLSYDEMMALMEEKQGPVGDEIMDIPIHTTEEYIDFLYKIKDLEIVENGRKVYAFGFAGDPADNWESFVYLGNSMYGTNWHQYTTHWNTKTNKIELPLMGDLIKQMAKTQNQLILDEVIDPESLAHTNAQFQSKIYQGVYAICCVTRAGALAKINEQLAETGEKFRYRPFWIDIPNPEGYEPFEVATAFSQAIAFFNTLSEEEVIQALKWADLQFTDEFLEILVWGNPEDYYEDENGHRFYTNQKFTDAWINGKGTIDVINSRGLNGKGSKLRITPSSLNPYCYAMMSGVNRLTPTTSSGFKFSPDSKYYTSVQSVPPCYAYSSEFGNVPDLIDFWARREEWEVAAKKAIAASEGQFEAKWNEMLATVNRVCDYKQMEKDMTEIALEYYELILASQE